MTAPQTQAHDDDHRPTDRRDALRRMLGTGLALGVVPTLIACAGPSRTTRLRSSARAMPDPDWPTPRRFSAAPSRPRPDYTPVSPTTPARPAINTALPSNVTARSAWAGGNPVPSLMDRMTPINRITLHHDGMTTFTTTSAAAAQTRIEAIRRAHRGRGWGDIGYHYVVDRAGRVWEGRSVAHQGAHVKERNPHNLGILVLGNFEQQTPSDAQLRGLNSALRALAAQHRVPAARIHTHRELNPTACPGRHLQPRVVAIRNAMV